MAYKSPRKRTYSKGKSRRRKAGKKNGGLRRSVRDMLRGPTPKEQEVRMRFRHLYSQMDLAESEGQINTVLSQGEAVRMKAPRGTQEMANYQYVKLAKKAKSRATYLGLKPYAQQLADMILGLGAAYLGAKGRPSRPSKTALALPEASTTAIETAEVAPDFFMPLA